MAHYTTKLLILAAFLFLGMAADILAAGGNLDTSFNGSGKLVFNIESSAVPGNFADVAVIGGNKFLVAGSALISGGNYYAITLSRFNSDGSLDTSFGAGGKVITDPGITSEGAALAVQSDGKIVVTGNAGSHPNRMTVVLRYTPDGVLDTTFGNNGVFFSSVMKVSKDISILADDKIIIAGISDVPNLGRTQVLKLNANGSPDTTFGNNGIASSTYAYGSDTDKIAIQSDGKIVVSGRNLFNVPRGLVHRFNPDGSPDPTFGTGGIREIDVGSSMYPGGLGLQPDGKIVLAGFRSLPGSNTEIMLARLNSDGSFDSSFGSGGFVFRDLSPDYDRAYNLVIQSDGKFVIGGQYDDNQAMLARFDSTGAVDTGFGTNGLLLLPAFNTSAIALQGTNLIVTGSASSSIYLARVSSAGAIMLFRNENFVTGKNDQARDVAIQPDGKIVAAGVSVSGNGNGVVSVARLLPNGSLDTSFGSEGRVTLSDGTNYSEANAVEIQPDGKIVVAGRGSQFLGFSFYTLFVARLNADGSPDNSFGTNGKVIITNPGNLIGYDMELQPDGKIVVGGTIQRVVGDGIFDFDMMAARLNPNGTLDGGFGSNGIFIFINGTAQMQSHEQAYALSIQMDGKIILAGTHMLRLNPNGTVDSTFSPTPVPLSFTARDIKLQPDGKIVLGGSQNSDFALARYNSNASIDTSFGINGITTLDFGGGDLANAIYIDTNGDIVAGGYTRVSSTSPKKFALARFKPNGSPDPAFGNGGKVVTDFGGDAEIFGLTRQSDGKIVAAGDAKVSIDRDYAVARYFSRTPAQFDFDGDGKADIAVFRPSNGFWYLLNSSNNAFTAVPFGASGDLTSPGDFDGDGKTDIAVFRPSTGGWYRLNSSNNTFTGLQFGTIGDLPVPGDFDGDGKADIAVFRPANGNWYRINSLNGQFVAHQFGANGDKPLVGDFDGDGKSDLAVFRPGDGKWYRINSSNNAVVWTQFGIAEDKTVAADYDSDGKTDLAVYRPSAGDWYILNSSNGGFTGVHFGVTEDKPIPADYDGDGRADLAVFRPSSGTWYLLRTTAGFTGIQFGASGDMPIPNAFVR